MANTHPRAGFIKDNKLNILLIRQTATYSCSELGVGIGIVGTLLDKAGHNVQIIDNNTLYKRYSNQDLLDAIVRFNPHAIGFGIVTSNAYHTYQLVKLVKKQFPHLILVAGGLHMKHSYQEALEHGIHIVVNREGEEIVVPLFDRLKNASVESFHHGLDSISGLSYFRDDGTLVVANEFPMIPDLDNVPLINYSLFNIKDFAKTGREPGFVYVIGQRGCPFKCSFCYDDIQHADRRAASGEWIFRNIEQLYRTFGFRSIAICDNNFTYPKQRVVDFCQRILQSDLAGKIEFSCQTKVETVLNDHLLDLMKRAGFTQIRLGLERLVPFSQGKINKTTEITKVTQTLEKLKRHHFNVSVFMLIGFPFETTELLERERQEFLNLRPFIQSIICSILQPSPGTTYYDDYAKAYRWYLDPYSVNTWRAYSNNVLDTYMEAQIDMNFFGLDQDTLNKLRAVYLEMKSLSQGTFSFTPRRTWIFQFFLMVDRMVAHFSKVIYNISPEVEFKIFSRISSIRLYFGTLLFSPKK